MTSATPALIAAAAGVGLGHAILPDHWVPLAVIGRTQKYPLTRVARLSALAGIAHVLVSLLLGAIIIVVGLQFRSTVESAQNTIIGIVLILTGLAFTVLELTGRGHSHSHGPDHDAEHGHRHGADYNYDGTHSHAGRRPGGLAAIMVSFGAAASPDLTILPVFLAATAAGVGTAVGSLIAFAAVTITTIIALTLLASYGGHQLHGQWLERWGNAVTAAALVIIGVLILTGAI